MAMTKTSSGLEYEDTQAGTGDTAAAGKTCVMHYTGWLWVDGAKTAKFDSSVDRGRPFSFALGKGQVIKGWDEGVAGMKIGAKRTLRIPPSSATARAAPAVSSRRTPRCCSRSSCSN